MYNNVLINTNNLPITILLIAVGCLVLITLLCFIFTYVMFRKTFTRTEKIATDYNPIYAPYKELMKQGANYFLGLNPEEVSIQSHDNLKLCGYFYETPNARGTVLFMHGYHGDPLNDFGPVLKHFIDIGFSVLLVFQRAHGKSGGHTITFGILEQYDCQDWVRYAAQRFGEDTPVVLYGVSMGAATVLTACALDLGKNVRGIVADCPYSTPCDIIRKTCREMHLPVKICFPFVRLAARLFGGFRLSDDGPHPLSSVSRTHLPILLIHGEADDFVPCDMSRRIAAVNPTVRLETFPGGVHAGSYLIDPQRYCRVIGEFVSDCGVDIGKQELT